MTAQQCQQAKSVSISSFSLSLTAFCHHLPHNCSPSLKVKYIPRTRPPTCAGFLAATTLFPYFFPTLAHSPSPRISYSTSCSASNSSLSFSFLVPPRASHSATLPVLYVFRPQTRFLGLWSFLYFVRVGHLLTPSFFSAFITHHFFLCYSPRLSGKHFPPSQRSCLHFFVKLTQN